MPRMSIRATYALDVLTDSRIKNLARLWQVSQAEVIRRSVKAAAEQNHDTLTPADAVKRYASEPLPRSRAETRRVIRSLRQLRHVDDDHRGTTAP